VGVCPYQKQEEEPQADRIGIGIDLIEIGEIRDRREATLVAISRKTSVSKAVDGMASLTSPSAPSMEGTNITITMTINSGSNHLRKGP
jgi:hypothetical protein